MIKIIIDNRIFTDREYISRNKKLEIGWRLSVGVWRMLK